MSSSYEKVRGSKLTFKGGLGIEKKISKKTKKKKQQKDQLVGENWEGCEVAVTNSTDPAIDIDTGTGHAPDGKKSKKYEELFPVETKRHGYVIPAVDSRSVALDERIKKKADRYCKKGDQPEIFCRRAEVHRSHAGHVDYNVAERGFSQRENTQLISKQVNSGDAQSSNRYIRIRDTTSAPICPPTIDLGKRISFAKTSSTADVNMCMSEESDNSTRKKVDFAISVGNEPNRLGLLQSNSELYMALSNRSKVCKTFAIGRFALSGMLVPQARAWCLGEDDLSPGTLLPAVNTSSCLGHNAETSREAASARVIYSLDDKK